MNNKQIIKSLIVQEWRLICRTPRGRKLFTGFILLQLAQVFLLMGWVENDSLHKSQFSLFLLICYGGMPLLSYMMFGMGWQGKNLVMYFSRQITLKHVLWSKYLFCVLVATASTIIPFIIFCCIGNLFLAVGSFVAIIFIAGFNAVLICLEYKRVNCKIDRQAGGLAANWQGMRAIQHILGIIYIVPIIIIIAAPVYCKLSEWYSLIAFILLGLAMLIITYRRVAYANNEKNKYFLINTFA